ncbi:hypothetical protein ZWY2020_001101 [Hordeum vulgare]|nr:hypothetical protein ZWY2020_001101 [Hordeum vulgare]
MVVPGRHADELDGDGDLDDGDEEESYTHRHSLRGLNQRNARSDQAVQTTTMTRIVLVAALVLCAAAALAHARRVVEELGRGSGLEASAEAPSRYAGGVKLRGLGSAGGHGGGFVDLLWSVFECAKDAFAAAVGWKAQ